MAIPLPLEPYGDGTAEWEKERRDRIKALLDNTKASQDIDAERRKAWCGSFPAGFHAVSAAQTTSVPRGILALWAGTLNTLAVALHDMGHYGLAEICANLADEVGEYEEGA
jgi:hypothetical protein